MKPMRILFTISMFSIFLSGFAQKKNEAYMDSLYVDSIRNIEYQLEGLSYRIINGDDKVERITSCYYFIQMLKKALKVPNSFDYDFTTLKTVSAIKPDNDAFRMFTWNLLLDSGKYMYFGAIQMNDGSDSLTLFGLYDSSEYNRDINYGTFDNRHWMGALVYQIHHYKWKKKDYYITFGWDGQDAKTNRKIIDVLWFDEEGKPQFGEEIFDFDGDLQSRLIFDFSDKSAMICRYDKNEKAIVFANLMVIKSRRIDQFEEYVPDGTYDFMKFEKGIWRRYPMMFENRGKKAEDLRRF